MIRKTILVNTLQFLRKWLWLLLPNLDTSDCIKTVIQILMFDGIYIESEMIFFKRIVLLNKFDWLVHCFHLHVQHFQFHIHCYMVFPNGSGFYIFRFGWSVWMNDKREKCKESIHKNDGSYKLWFNFDKQSKMSCHCNFLHSEKGVLLFAVRRLYFTTLSVNKCKQIYKFNFPIKGHVHFVYRWVGKLLNIVQVGGTYLTTF